MNCSWGGGEGVGGESGALILHPSYKNKSEVCAWVSYQQATVHQQTARLGTSQQDEAARLRGGGRRRAGPLL